MRLPVENPQGDRRLFSCRQSDRRDRLIRGPNGPHLRLQVILQRRAGEHHLIPVVRTRLGLEGPSGYAQVAALGVIPMHGDALRDRISRFVPHIHRQRAAQGLGDVGEGDHLRLRQIPVGFRRAAGIAVELEIPRLILKGARGDGNRPAPKIGAVQRAGDERTLPDADGARGNAHGPQGVAVLKRPVADGLQRVREGNGPQAGVHIERPVADCRHIAAEGHMFQLRAVIECLLGDDRHAAADHGVGHAVAHIERLFAQGGNRIRDRHGCQRYAVVEGLVADTAAVRVFTHGNGFQVCAILKSPCADAGPADIGGPQLGAVLKRLGAHRPDPRRQCDALKAGLMERQGADRLHALRQGDGRDGSPGKRVFSDLGNAAPLFKHSARQSCGVAESPFAQGGHRTRNRYARKGGFTEGIGADRLQPGGQLELREGGAGEEGARAHCFQRSRQGHGLQLG